MNNKTERGGGVPIPIAHFEREHLVPITHSCEGEPVQFETPHGDACIQGRV